MDVPRGVLPNEKPKILLVEDDSAVRRSLQLLLQANGFDVRAYATSAALLGDASAREATCLVADYRMSHPNGVDTLATLRAEGWNGPAILITAFPSDDVRDDATRAGFAAIFEKPLRQHVLVRTVERLVRPATGG